jgi:hypothetical protein
MDTHINFYCTMVMRHALEKLASSWGISLSDVIRFAAGKLLTEEGIDYKEQP